MADPISPPGSAAVRPGIATSEGILTILSVVASLVAQYQGAIPEPWGSVVAATVTAIYTIARTVLKARAVGAAPAAP